MRRQLTMTNQEPQELMKERIETRNGKSQGFHAETTMQNVPVPLLFFSAPIEDTAAKIFTLSWMHFLASLIGR